MDWDPRPSNTVVLWVADDTVHKITYVVYLKDGLTHLREYNWGGNWYGSVWWRSARDLVEMICITRREWVNVYNKEWIRTR